AAAGWGGRSKIGWRLPAGKTGIERGRCFSTLRENSSETLSLWRRPAHNPFLLRLRQFADRVAHPAEPARVVAGQQHDRPIRSVHQALRTECPQNHIDVRLKSFRRPSLRIRFGDHAGELAVDV